MTVETTEPPNPTSTPETNAVNDEQQHDTEAALAPGIGAGDHGALTGALDEITQNLPAPLPE